MLGTDVVVSVLTIIRRGRARKRVVKIRRVSVWIFLKRDFLGTSQCSTHTLLRIYTLIAKHRVVIRIVTSCLGANIHSNRGFLLPLCR